MLNNSLKLNLQVQLRPVCWPPQPINCNLSFNSPSQIRFLVDLDTMRKHKMTATITCEQLEDPRPVHDWQSEQQELDEDDETTTTTTTTTNFRQIGAELRRISEEFSTLYHLNNQNQPRKSLVRHIIEQILVYFAAAIA